MYRYYTRRGETGSLESTEKITFVGVVYPWYIDHMEHMNVQYYASMFDQATWVFLSGFGITSDYMKKNHRVTTAVNQVTKYLHELFSGDVVEVRTLLLEVTESKVKFVHTMWRTPDSGAVATSELIGAHFDTLLHRASPFPAEIASKLTQNLSR